MDTQVPIKKHGREWKPGASKRKQLQAPKYLETFELQEDEEIDTTGYSYRQLYNIAKDAVKKRARYTPV